MNMELIDKSALVAEIERRIKELEPFKTEDNLRAHGAIAGYYQILSFIRTLEVKEEKYEAALEKARECLKDGTITNVAIGYIEEIFPELKESEDEQHRRWILEYLYDGLRKSDEQFKGQFKAAIAWLEKQESLTTNEEKQGKEDVLWCIKQAKKYAKDENEMGTCWFAEQWLEKQGDKSQGKTIRQADIEIPFGAKDSELQEASYHIPEGFYAEIQGDMVVIKKGEKKSSWSEEDENNLIDACVAIRKFYHSTNGAQELIDWLKSIKQRKSWKPSEGQIIALRWVLNNIPYNTHKEEISGLLEQIKDL